MKSSTAATVATTILASSISSVSAQDQYRINPNSVSNTTRDAWCSDQTSQCPLICLDQGATGTTLSNTCDAASLTYSCVCDNGISPNVSEYSQTLPYNICSEWGTQCVSNCGADTTCAAACREDHPCGALNPTRQNTSTLTSTRTTTSAGASESGDGGHVLTTDSAGETVTIYTGFGGSGGGGAAASNTGGSGGSESAASVTMVRVWALSAGQTFGTLVLAGAAALGFAVLL